VKRTIRKHNEKSDNGKRPVKLDGKHDEGYQDIDESRNDVEKHKLAEAG
jgi:hypothetical protein